MQKTKVLLLLHELTVTGAPKIALEVFEASRDLLEVRILSLRGGPFREIASRLGPLEVLQDSWSLRGWRWHYHQRFQFKSWLRDLNRWSPDLIYANSVASLPIASMVSLPEAPAILHVHELRSETEGVMAAYPDLLTRWPSRYIAVSTAVVQNLQTTCGIDPGRIALIHEFVTERNFSDAALPASPGRGDEFVVGGCGTSGWRKGTTLWFQMAAELRRLIGPRARFIWVGVPEQLAGCPLRNQARLMGLGEAIEFVPITLKPLTHFARFDVFAMTSLEDPCPLVVLESMLLGKPVACFSAGGGAPEEVGETGLIIDDFCPREMARRFAELASSPGELARRGVLAQERVRAHFTDRVQVPKIRRELSRVLLGRNEDDGASADSSEGRPLVVSGGN